MDLEQREACSITSTSRLAGTASAAASTSVCYYFNECTNISHSSSYSITCSTPSFLVGIADSSRRCCRGCITDPRTNPKRNSNSGINYTYAIPSDSTLGKPTSCFPEFSAYSKSCWSLSITTSGSWHEFSTFHGFSSPTSADRFESI